VNNAREILGRFVHKVFIAVSHHPTTPFLRIFPLKFTVHPCTILQPELRALNFSTNPQRSSQQQSYSSFLISESLVKDFTVVQILRRSRAAIVGSTHIA
jgi:hypothetical protein